MPEALQLLRGLVSAVHTLSSKLERVEGRLEQLDGATAAAGSPSGRRSSPTAGGGVRKRATVFDGDDTAAMLDQLRVSKEQQKAQAVFDDDGDSGGDEEGGVGGGGDDAEGKKERNGATRKSTSSGKTSPLGKKSTSKLGALAGAAGFSKSWGRNKWRNAKSKVTAQLGPVRIKLTPAIVQPEPPTTHAASTTRRFVMHTREHAGSSFCSALRLARRSFLLRAITWRRPSTRAISQCLASQGRLSQCLPCLVPGSPSVLGSNRTCSLGPLSLARPPHSFVGLRNRAPSSSPHLARLSAQKQLSKKAPGRDGSAAGGAHRLGDDGGGARAHVHGLN